MSSIYSNYCIYMLYSNHENLKGPKNYCNTHVRNLIDPINMQCTYLICKEAHSHICAVIRAVLILRLFRLTVLVAKNVLLCN
jgi:hypothetical protein